MNRMTIHAASGPRWIAKGKIMDTQTWSEREKQVSRKILADTRGMLPGGDPISLIAAINEAAYHPLSRGLRRAVRDAIEQEIIRTDQEYADASAWAEPYTVNGLLYPTISEATAVRDALVAEGIGHHYPGTPAAHHALAKHGVTRRPQVGERWGCGDHQGVVVRYVEDEVVICIDIHASFGDEFGREFQYRTEILSPARIAAGGKYIG